MKRFLIPSKFREKIAAFDSYRRTLERQSILHGLQLSRVAVERKLKSLHEAEFSVFSQFGEDGILDYLISHLDIPSKYFIEIGTENYEEANTRFLLQSRFWEGLLIEANSSDCAHIRGQDYFWRHRLTVENCMVEPLEIEEILSRNSVPKTPGLLSIDIDGVDYWAWKAVESYKPVIVVMEYNYRFGPDSSVTVPYSSGFQRTKAHYSNIYFGASLGALAKLANEKGYALLGCNQAGNNAFFVDRDYLEGLKARTGLSEVAPNKAWVRGSFREARNQDGTLSFLTFEAEQSLLQSLPTVSV